MPDTIKDTNQLPLYPGVDLQSSNSLIGNISSNTPETGKPVSVINDFLKQYKNPYEVALQTNNPAATPLYPTLRYTSDALGYDYRDANIEYKYGDKYPVLSFFNNMGKFGANFVGAFAQGVATLPFAIKAIKDKDPEVFFNNEMTNGIQQWIEELETSMPSYKTEYQDTNTFTSAFNPFQLKAFVGTWGDILKNLGFTAGAITSALVQDAVVGLATEGVGAVPLISMQLAKLGKWASAFGKGVKGFNEAKSSIGIARDAVNIASGIKNVTSRIGYGTKLLTSSLAEGSIEANQTYRTLNSELRQHFIDKYGYEPIGEELDKIDNYSIQGANANLLANTALLTLTNAITFDGLLKGRALTRLTLEKELANKTAIERTGLDNFALKTKIDPFKSFGEKIGYYGTKYGSKLVRPATEAFEEGSQFMSDKTVRDYIGRRYYTENMTYTDNLSESLSNGLKATFLTKDGQYNMFLGALSGGLSNVLISKIQKSLGYQPTKSQMSDQTKSIITLLNNNSLTGLFRHTYNEASTSVGILKDLKNANEKGDIFTFKNLQKQNFFNFILSGIKTNRSDLRIEQLKDLKNLNPQQFTELTEAEFNEDNQGEFNQYVDNLITEAESMKKSIEKVNKVFVNRFDHKKNSEEYNIFEDYKDALSYSIVLTDDSLNRANKLSGEVTNIFPGLDINKAVNLVNYKGVRQTVSEFQDRIAELKETKKGLDPKDSVLYDNINREINFLEQVSKTLSNTLTYNEAIENLQPLMDEKGRVTKRDIPNTRMLDFGKNIDYERDLGRLFEYFSNGTVTDTIQSSKLDAVERTSVIRSLQDIFKLDVQGRTAIKYYNTLATNKGYNKFRDDVKNRLKQYSSRIEVDEQGNFKYKTDQEIEAEKEALITAVSKMQEDLRKQANLSLPEEKASNEEVKIIEKVVEKEAKGQEITEEEEKVKSENPNIYTNKTVARKKAEEANVDLMNELNIIDPATLEDDTKIETVEDSEKIIPTKEEKVPIQSKTDTKYQGVNPYSILGRVFGNHLSVKDQDGIALQNIFNLIFQMPLNEAVKSLSQNIKFVVSKSTSGAPAGKFVEIRHENTSKKVYENLLRQGYEYEVQVYNGDQFLGILTLGNSLFYKNIKGEMIPISQVSKAEYERATIKNNPDGTKRSSNSISTYEEFITLAKGYENAANSIINSFKSGKNEFNSQDIANIFSSIKLWQGVLDIQSKPADNNNVGGTLVSELQYLPDDTVILQIPYSEDKRSNSSNIQIIGKDGVLLLDTPLALSKFISDNIDRIQKIDQRYILIIPTPDGNYYSNFSIIGLRHSSVVEADLDAIFKSIIKDSKTRANNNLDQLYINLKSGTENQDGISIKFKKTRDYGINIHINDKNSKARETITIPEKTLKTFKNIDDLLAHVSDNSDILLKYETGVFNSDIKYKNINFNNTDFKYLSENLIAAVSPSVAKDFYIYFVPEENQNTSQTVVEETKTETETIPSEDETLYNSIFSSPSLGSTFKIILEGGKQNDFTGKLDSLAQQAIDAPLETIAQIGKENADKLFERVSTEKVQASLDFLKSLGFDNKNAAILEEIINKRKEQPKAGSGIEDVISDNDFNTFIDNGKVNYNILDSIANKIILNAPLSIREQAIFNSKTSEINNIIVQIHDKNSKVNTKLTIEEYAKDLYNLGYEKKDIDNMTVSKAHEIISKNITKKYTGYFATFKKIRILAESLKSDLSDDEKNKISKEISDLQEQIVSSSTGQLSALIERDFEDIISNLEKTNQIEKDCK